MQETFARVAQIISENADVPIGDIKPESHVMKDLGVDSLAFLDIAFEIDQTFNIKLPIEEQARRLARAAGHVGSCAEYLHKTVHTLHQLGIHDTYLWRLQHLVAEEIRRMQTAKDKGASS